MKIPNFTNLKDLKTTSTLIDDHLSLLQKRFISLCSLETTETKEKQIVNTRGSVKVYLTANEIINFQISCTRNSESISIRRPFFQLLLHFNV